MPSSRSPRGRKGFSESSPTSPKKARMQQVTKQAIKKFGPFVLTGLAAIAEHHWLKKEDSASSKHEHEHSDREIPKLNHEDSVIRGLREEVADLKRDLKHKEKRSEERAFRAASPNLPSRVHDRDVEFDFIVTDDTTRGQQFTEMPFAPTPPVSYPAPFPDPFQDPFPGYQPPVSDLEDFPSIRGGHHDRGIHHHRHRSHSRSHKHHGHHHLSVPRPRHLSPTRTTSDGIWQAGKVAAVAGLVEALHVDDGKGDWIGKKGLRVGTTAAASFSATYVRDRDPEDYRMRDVAADVGAGVLVSRLVYGKARRGQGMGRGGRPDQGDRRWSYCY